MCRRRSRRYGFSLNSTSSVASLTWDFRLVKHWRSHVRTTVTCCSAYASTAISVRSVTAFWFIASHTFASSEKRAIPIHLNGISKFKMTSLCTPNSELNQIKGTFGCYAGGHSGAIDSITQTANSSHLHRYWAERGAPARFKYDNNFSVSVPICAATRRSSE